MNTNEVSSPNGNKRPESLSIICVLSFFGSGLASFSNLVIFFSFDMLYETYSSGGLNLPGADIIFSFSKSFYFISFIFYSTSLAGAYLMWKLRKTGFHVYAISQILLLILPTLYVKTDQFPLLGIMITGVFILLYFRHLKFMH